MVPETTDQYIEDVGGRKYFTMLPNLLDDVGLSPYAFRLLVHYYRVCGGNSTCYEGVRTTAKRTCMSVGKVSESRRELEQDGWIKLRAEQFENRPAPTLVVSIQDRWKENMEQYENGSPSVKAKAKKKKAKPKATDAEQTIKNRTVGIKDAYVELLGYGPKWYQGEGKAARQIAEKYSVSQFRQAYTYYKSQKFWQDKKLSLRFLLQQMPEWERNNDREKAGHHTSSDIGDFLAGVSG